MISLRALQERHNKSKEKQKKLAKETMRKIKESYAVKLRIKHAKGN